MALFIKNLASTIDNRPQNYLYLSRILAKEKSEERRAALLESIRNGSMVTWAHFNLHGEFDFSDERMVDSIGLIPPKNPGLELG